MNYSEARQYLDQIASSGWILGLESMTNLLAELGDPQDRLKFVHIAGTNGKGSVLAYLSTILKEAGYVTGRYISPTLFSYREKIQVNEEYISREDVAACTEEIARAVERIRQRGGALPTLFEAETAMAFLYFVKKKCDIVVLETGMGGDTDATNVITTSVVEVLVSISRDHMQYLGDTLAEIAGHKAGILKKDTFAVSALQEPSAMEVIEKRANELNVKLTVADWTKAEDVRYGIEEQTFSYGAYRDIVIHLGGSYQIKNAVTALEAVGALKKAGFDITEEALRAGFEKTVWRGRFTVIGRDPTVIIDGAHNPDGAGELKKTIRNCLAGRRIYGICGVFRDKEYEEVLALITPHLTELVTIRTPGNPRALPAEELKEAALKYMDQVSACDSIEQAVADSIRKAKEQDGVVLVFGSLSHLGDVAACVEGQQS